MKDEDVEKKLEWNEYSVVVLDKLLKTLGNPSSINKKKGGSALWTNGIITVIAVDNISLTINKLVIVYRNYSSRIENSAMTTYVGHIAKDFKLIY